MANISTSCSALGQTVPNTDACVGKSLGKTARTKLLSRASLLLSLKAVLWQDGPPVIAVLIGEEAAGGTIWALPHETGAPH